MKPDIHPEYREVVFQDTSSGLTFLTRSTMETSETIEFEGETYPLAKVDISSESHPFYTGKQILVDSGGRVERFRRRYAKVGVDTEGSGMSRGAAPGAEAAPAVQPADENPEPAEDS